VRAIPIAAIPIAPIVPIMAIMAIVPIVAMVVAVAIVSLRGRNHAADECKRQGRSSNDAFHSRSPDTPDEPAWDALSNVAPDPKLNVFRQLPFRVFLSPAGALARDGT
jgi:hypothetical protein